MSDDSFMIDMLRGIQSAVAQTNQRLDKIESHMGNLERRQSASMHFEKSIHAHFAALHESMDDLKSDMRAIRSEMRDVHGRLERVESR